MLMATDLGLESLWFTFFDPIDVKSILNIPDRLDVAGAVLIGEAAMETKAPKRNMPCIHRDVFDPGDA